MEMHQFSLNFHHKICWSQQREFQQSQAPAWSCPLERGTCKKILLTVVAMQDASLGRVGGWKKGEPKDYTQSGLWIGSD